MARKLRIAASVFFGLLTVTLCVLWVRSYWVDEGLIKSISSSQALNVSSSDGVLHIIVLDGDIWGRYQNGRLTHTKNRVIGERRDFLERLVLFSTADNQVGFPYWAPISIFAIAALAPWIKLSSRFSLRTLLIATTMVAIVLALGVWLAS